MDAPLTADEKRILLSLARDALQSAVCSGKVLPIDLDKLPVRLREPGATFVTLTMHGQLRGCIGSLEARRALAEDVREHAAAAALHDYRFTRLNPGDVCEVVIEVSYLTNPKKLDYDCPEDLLTMLRPGVDGVVLRDGPRRATFLPQVWEKIPTTPEFLSHLCMKMGGPLDLWQSRPLEVEIYQVEEFDEGPTPA